MHVQAKFIRSSASIGAVLLSFSYALALFNRSAGMVLVVVLAASLEVGVSTLVPVGAAFFWVYALFQLPSGVLADVMGPRRLAVLGGIVTGIGSLIFSHADDVLMLTVARGVVAAGCSVVFVSLMRHIRANWDERRVATISGRSILVGNVGSISAALPLSFLLAVVNWRVVWDAIGVISFLGAAVLWVCMADAHEPKDPWERVRTVRLELMQVIANRHNQIGFLLLAGLAGTYYALAGFWAVPLLVENGIGQTTAAMLASLLIAGYAVGACALGWLGDRTSRRAVLSAACLGASLLWAMIILHEGRGVLGWGVTLFLLGFCSGGFNLVYSLVTEMNPLEHAGSVTAFVNIGIFVGAGLTQNVSGVLYEVGHGSHAHMLAPMLLGAMGAFSLSLILFLRAAEVAKEWE